MDSLLKTLRDWGIEIFLEDKHNFLFGPGKT